MSSLLSVNNLSVRYRGDHGVTQAVDGLSFELTRGQSLGLVGESGCGKSTAALALLGLLPAQAHISGSCQLDGTVLTTTNLPQVRGRRIAMIFQDPMTCLTPHLRIGKQLTEHMRLHRKLSQQEATKRALDLLSKVALPNPQDALAKYPHQFSGGQRQRIMIALALACEPDVLIADEPTTALDVTVQASVLRLIRELQNEHQFGLIFVSHDLAVIAQTCSDVAVMYGGKIVEQAPTKHIFTNPRHPYTQALLGSMPHNTNAANNDQANAESDNRTRLITIPGQPPRLAGPWQQCAFAPRCAYATDACRSAVPNWQQHDATTHGWRCPIAQNNSDTERTHD